MPVQAVVRRLRSVFQRRSAEAELAEELALHVALQTKKHMESGLSEADAKRAALIQFGSLVSAREECRETDRWAALDTLARNVRYATRSLLGSRGFSLVAIAIVAIGFGSTLAVCNLLNAVLFRSLPVESPGELVRISTVNDGQLGTLPAARQNKSSWKTR